MVSLTPAEWGRLIRQGKWAGLLARLDALIGELGLAHEMPSQAKDHLVAARVISDNEQRILRWEVNRIQRALVGTGVPVVFLKGAAYLVMNLPTAHGRMSSDIDILVPKEKLNIVEKALLEGGWEPTKLDDYDQYFYRNWSHELPPLRHRDRGTVVDVHHTILPLTGRVHPDPEKLLEAAVPFAGEQFRVLAPVDMVLHSAAHAFQDGDLQRGLRDLVDLDDLLRYFAGDTAFWDELLRRAAVLELSRPLYYALHYTHRVLKTPLPEDIRNAYRQFRPMWPASAVMDHLVTNVLRPRPAKGEGFASGLSPGLLYVRSHWLRMPPWLLTWHLSRKMIRARLPSSK